MAANFLTSFFASGLGSFIAGASKQYVKQDEADQQEERRIAAEVREQETWDKRFKKQQDAINARTSNEKRKANQKSVEEATQALKAAGYNDEIVQKALSVGNTYANTIAGYGLTAIQNGADPNILFKYAKDMDEFKAAVGPQGRYLGDVPEGFDKSSYLEFDPTALGAILKPVPKPVTSIAALRAATVDKMLSLEPDSLEYQAASKRNEQLLAEQLKTAKKTNGDPFSNADLTRDFKLAQAIANTGLGFKSLDGQIDEEVGGRVVASHVAVINAAKMMLERNNTAEVQSNNLVSFVSPAVNGAYDAIRANAKELQAMYGATEEERVSNPNQAEDRALFESFYIPPPDGKISYTSAEAQKMYTSGKTDTGAIFKIGSTLMIDGRLQSYIGTKLTYKGIGQDSNEEISWPFIWARPSLSNGDSRYFPIGFSNDK